MTDYLAKIKIKNFQGHEELEYEFPQGVTTLIGSSDVGKSAVLRAIRWVAMNDPSGDSFIRWGAKKAEVELTFASGHVVRRVKGAGVNSYWLDEKEFVAFGNNVPPEILSVMSLVVENFQQQHDQPFWISETSGEISRQLNKIVNLRIIDHTMAELSSRGRSVKVEIDVIAGQLEEAVSLRDSLLFAEEMDSELEMLEGEVASVSAVQSKVLLLGALLDRVKQHSAVVLDFEECAAEAEFTLLLGKDWDSCDKERAELAILLQRLVACSKDADRTVPDLSSILKSRDVVQKLMDDHINLLQLITKVYTQEEVIDSDQWNLDDAVKKLEKEIGEVCPLCNQTIK